MLYELRKKSRRKTNGFVRSISPYSFEHCLVCMCVCACVQIYLATVRYTYRLSRWDSTLSKCRGSCLFYAKILLRKKGEKKRFKHKKEIIIIIVIIDNTHACTSKERERKVMQAKKRKNLTINKITT